MGIHILLMALAVGQPFEATASAPMNSAEVTKLISQLGSNQFKEREAATQALNVLGAPALTPLRQAAQAKDPEIRHRAEILAQQIQKRLETAQILEPKRVRLVLSDRPLSEAVAELAGKSGFPIQLEGAIKNRRITLDTGTTTFWEALDQFCRKASLVERAAPAVHGQEVRIWNARAGAPGQMVVIDRASRMSGPPGADDRLTLVPSRDKPPLLPDRYDRPGRILAPPPAHL